MSPRWTLPSKCSAANRAFAGDAGAGWLAGRSSISAPRPRQCARRRQFGAAHTVSSVSPARPRGCRQGGARRLAIFQLSCAATTPLSRTMSSRAIANGYTASCLTVDTAHYGRRERDIAKRPVREAAPAPPAAIPEGAGLEHRQMDQGQVQDSRWSSRTSRRQAPLALDHGVEWITCRNDGGRQLDPAGSSRCCPRSSMRPPAAPRSWSTGFMRHRHRQGDRLRRRVPGRAWPAAMLVLAAKGEAGGGRMLETAGGNFWEFGPARLLLSAS